MATQTLERPKEDLAEKPTKAKVAAKGDSSRPKKTPTRPAWLRMPKAAVPPRLVAWSLFLRGIVLAVDYVVVTVVVTGIIPMLGVFLHRQAAAAGVQLSLEGKIAVWGMPLLAATLLITTATYVLLRALWRWSSRRIEKLRDDVTEPEPETSRARSRKAGK